MINKKCAFCNGDIIGRKKSAKYCSMRCNNNSYRLKNTAKINQKQSIINERVRHKESLIPKYCKICSDLIKSKNDQKIGKDRKYCTPCQPIAISKTLLKKSANKPKDKIRVPKYSYDDSEKWKAWDNVKKD